MSATDAVDLIGCWPSPQRSTPSHTRQLSAVAVLSAPSAVTRALRLYPSCVAARTDPTSGSSGRADRTNNSRSRCAAQSDRPGGGPANEARRLIVSLNIRRSSSLIFLGSSVGLVLR